MEIRSEQLEFDGGPVWICTVKGKTFQAYADNDITGIYYRKVNEIDDLVFMPWSQIEFIMCSSPIERADSNNG